MKFSTEVEINLPVAKVVALFDDPENLKHWQPGFKNFEHVSGTPGQPGAKSKLLFQMGKREIEMIETITVRNLPQEFSGTYEATGVFNIVKNYFVPIDENKTKYISEQEFQFRGSMKIIGWLMPGMFKKQSLDFLQRFKTFAEKAGA